MGRLVTIASFVNPAEAHLAQGRLASAGIPSFLTNEHLVGVKWIYSTAVGGVEVRVFEHDAAEAHFVLSCTVEQAGKEEVLCTPDGGEGETGEGVDWETPDPECPVCGSTDIAPKPSPMLTVLLFLCFMLPIPIFTRSMRCHACGHAWKPGL